MILLELFWEFFKIGLFSFGGAYAAIPMIRDSALSQGWMNEEMFENVVAISESTPGPIMVNAATYIGGCQGGVLGATVATLGVVLPSFIIILFVAMFFHKWMKNKRIQTVLSGIKPAVAGIILATGCWMAISRIFPERFTAFDYKALIIIVVLGVIQVLWNRLRKKEFSPIGIIAISALAGIVIYS